MKNVIYAYAASVQIAAAAYNKTSNSTKDNADTAVVAMTPPAGTNNDEHAM